MDALSAALDQLIGLGTEPDRLSLLQMCARAAIIYFIGLTYLRVGEHRFIGKNTAFDVVLGFIFGSTLSRAINGSAAFLETLVATAVLLLLHRLFAMLAFHSDRFNVLINGRALPIIKDGQVDERVARKTYIDDRLLKENLRLQSGTEQIDKIHSACYERNGGISVETKPAVEDVTVEVADGVQTVHIRIQR